MKLTTRSATIALLSLSAALLSACSSMSSTSNTEVPESKTSVSEARVKGVPGGATTRVTELTARVVAIDYDKRSVTFEDSKGNRQVLIAGPEIVNFEQIKKGDLLKATVAEEVVVYVRKKGAPANDGGGIVAAKAAPGEKPAAMVAATNEITATVKAIDLKAHTATLQFPDGSTKTVAVRPDVDLSKHKKGDEVVINATTAVAIAIQKP